MDCGRFQKISELVHDCLVSMYYVCFFLVLSLVKKTNVIFIADRTLNYVNIIALRCVKDTYLRLTFNEAVNECPNLFSFV